MTIAEIGPASDVKGFFNLMASLLENGVKGSKYPWVLMLVSSCELPLVESLLT